MEALLNSKLRQGFEPSRVARIDPVRIMKWFCPIFLVLCLPEKTGWKHPEVRRVRLCGHHLEGFCSRDSAGISQLRVRAPRFHTNRKPPTNPVLFGIASGSIGRPEFVWYCWSGVSLYRNETSFRESFRYKA